jgi:hypothetical protein
MKFLKLTYIEKDLVVEKEIHGKLDVTNDII